MTEPQLQVSETYSTAIAGENENAMDNDATADDVKTEYDSEDYEETSVDNQQFILAPTPAQLGRAPLQRRLGSLAGGEYSISRQFSNWIFNAFSTADAAPIVSEAALPNTHPIIPTPTSVPSALPTPNSAIMDEALMQNPGSPTMQKKPIFKKGKGEDLNK